MKKFYVGQLVKCIKVIKSVPITKGNVYRIIKLDPLTNYENGTLIRIEANDEGDPWNVFTSEFQPINFQSRGDEIDWLDNIQANEKWSY